MTVLKALSVLAASATLVGCIAVPAYPGYATEPAYGGGPVYYAPAPVYYGPSIGFTVNGRSRGGRRGHRHH